nr:hypothetical protein [Tanacetum cinerariifolium]
MDTTIEQQVAMDEALVPSTQRCPFFKAFLVTADVPEIYMQEFWATVNVHHHALRFKMDNKKHIVNLESFRDMLHICPRIPGQSFDELPFEEEILDFFRFLGHSATIRTLTDVNLNKLYQPWRSFAAVINKCLTGKSSGYDSLRLSQALILWGLYHKRNIDYAFLIWEDFVYQVEHKNHKKSNKMYYPRFTKVIIHHFMSKDPSIPRRNKSKDSTLQLVYDVLRICPFFKAFLFTADVPEIYMQEFWATANVHHHALRFKMDNKKHIVNLESFRDMLLICPRIPGQSFDKLPFEEEILDFFRNIDYAFLIWEDFVYQVKHKNHKKSNEMYYPRFTKVIIHHFMSKDPFIPRRNKVNWHYVRDDYMFSTIKVVSRHQNTQQYGAMLPIELTNEEIRNTKAYKEYYAFATGEAVPKPKASARRTRSGSDTSITSPTAAVTPKPTAATTPRLTAAAKGKQPAKAPKAKSLFTLSEVAMTEAEQLKLVLKRSREQMHISQPGGFGTDKGTGADDQGKDRDDDEGDKGDESDDKEEDDDEDKNGDERDDDDDEDQEVAKIDKQYDAEGGGDDDEESENDEEDDDKETRDEKSFDPIPITPKSSEDDGNDEEDQGLKTGVESIFATASTSIDPLPTPTPTMTLSIIASTTIASQAPIPPMTFPSDIIQHLSSFGSLFRFDDRLKELEANFSEFSQTNPFAEAVFVIPGIVYQYMNQQMNEASMNAQLEAEVLTRSSHLSRTSYVVAADLSEMELKKILIEKMEGNKSIQRSDEQRNLYKALVEAYEANKIILDTYGENRGSKRRREGKEPESASAPLETATRSAGRSTTGSRSRQASASKSAFAEEPVQTTSQMDEPSHSNKTLLAVQGSTQTWISELAKKANSRSSFNELLDTTLDFSNFIMNRLRVDTLTLELFAGPTYELMKGSCKSLIELEYHLEEVYKATTNQSDWVNLEGQQYLHNLLQPLPLIPNNRGRCVIPFAHFINNDLEYLQEGASSRKYTTSVTKTKAADYGHIKWIEDLVPRTIWIQEPIDYDKHALWGVSHCGRKCQQFYGFAINQESARDIYSKRRIIAVTDLKIVEWHSYKLRLQDIEDMLLLLVQGKLSNLTVEERFAFNVSLRMFTRSIVKQRRVEDLQLGVKSYQKRLNLTKPDTYRSDLKRREAYTAYLNPRGFIYKNKDKKNRFMRIDELHKFSDGMLNDVRTALDDRLKRIRMRYLP